jgi:hypothetical protein
MKSTITIKQSDQERSNQADQGRPTAKQASSNALMNSKTLNRKNVFTIRQTEHRSKESHHNKDVVTPWDNDIPNPIEITKSAPKN